MRILAIDVGTGTQDILLFDSTQPVANCVKLVLPSATSIVRKRVQRATQQRWPLLLTGVTMGGGPCAWAIEDHLRAGLPVYATPEAAQTLNDDLDFVQQQGVVLVSEDEARRLEKAERIEMKDVNVEAILGMLRSFEVEVEPLEGVAIAVLDHGAAPPGVSDRLFRFDHLRHTIERRNSLYAFAYLAEELPDYLTRMRAVVRTVGPQFPLLLLDTGPAGALGALEDPQVSAQEERLILNLGNMHTLATLLVGESIEALFEHHTGEVTAPQLERFVHRLLSGELTHEEIFQSMGHGAYYVRRREYRPFIAVTGPRRSLLRGASLPLYFATPHGDMMLSGCFGLVRAFGERMENWREEIQQALAA